MQKNIKVKLNWGKYRAKTLKPEDIIHAQQLLYDVYFLEAGWVPAAGNPSGLKIRHPANGEAGRYVDDFDPHVIWLGVFDSHQLLGVARVIRSSSVCGLEVARYCHVPAHLLQHSIELNRLAIRQNHRASMVHTLLFMLASRVAWAIKCKYALIAPAVSFSKFMQRQGFLHSGISFKYHENDPLPVDLLYYPVALSKVLKTFATMVVSPLGKLMKKRRQK